MTSDLIFHVNHRCGQLALNRPKALNSLTLAMVRVMHHHAFFWSEQEEVDWLLFPTLQQKVYCAGGDIRWLYQQGKDHQHEQQMAFFAEEYRLDYAISHLDIPVVAIVDGFLIGGGMGLLMPARTIYATQEAAFSMPETGIGFFPDVGMAYRFNQCPGNTGLYLALTGHRFSAQDASYLGLINGVLSAEDAQTLQHQCNDTGELSTYQDFTLACARKARQYEEAPIGQYHSMIEDVFSQPSLVAIFDKLASISHDWAKQTLKQLMQACPLSLHITFELMRRTKTVDLATAYQLDYVVASHFMSNADFYEGVRAQVIDKDRKPKWQYEDIKSVPRSIIEQFFDGTDRKLDLTYNPEQLIQG